MVITEINYTDRQMNEHGDAFMYKYAYRNLKLKIEMTAVSSVQMHNVSSFDY